MTIRIAPAVATVALVCLAAGPTAAVTSTFFGEDTGGFGIPAPPAASDPYAAELAFISQLTSFGTEDFESFANGAPAPLAVSFGAAASGTLTGTASGSVTTFSSGFGGYPIDGSQFYKDGTGGGAATFASIAFDSPVTAFGTYIDGYNTLSGQDTLLSLVTQDGMGNMTEHTIPNSNPLTGGSTLFFGLIDTASFVQVDVVTTAGTAGDGIGLDRMIAGHAVPEPGSVVLGAACLLGLGFVRRRRRS